MPECNRVNPLSWADCASDKVTSVTTDAVASAAGSAIDQFAEAVSVAVGDGLAALGTLWVSVDTPNLAGGSTGGRSAGTTPPGAEQVDQVLGYLLYVGLAVCVVSLMVAGARMAMPHRYAHGEGEETARVGTVLMATIVISASVALVGGLFRGRVARGGDSTAFLQNSLWYYVLAVAIVSIIVAGIKMAWEQRAQPGRDVVGSLMKLLLISGAGLPVLGILVEASDAFSEWIIASSLDCDPAAGDGSCFRRNITGLIAFGSGGVGAPFMVIVLGLVALVTSLIQIMLMVARAGMLVVLAGVLPLAAAATNTDTGSAWFKRTIGWLLAWLLYKPAAAIIYATAFHLAGTDVFDDKGLVKVLTGLILLIMAVVAIGPLMKFAVPAVSTMASSSGGSGVAMMAAAAPAMGAVSAGGRASGSQGQQASAAGPGPSGSSGPASGATTSPSGGSGPGGSSGRSGTDGVPGQRGDTSAAPAGAAARSGGGAAAGGSGGGAAASGGGAAAGGVGVALQAAAKTAQAAQGAAQRTAQESTGQEGEQR